MRHAGVRKSVSSPGPPTGQSIAYRIITSGRLSLCHGRTLPSLLGSQEPLWQGCPRSHSSLASCDSCRQPSETSFTSADLLYTYFRVRQASQNRRMRASGYRLTAQTTIDPIGCHCPMVGRHCETTQEGWLPHVCPRIGDKTEPPPVFMRIWDGLTGEETRRRKDQQLLP